MIDAVGGFSVAETAAKEMIRRLGISDAPFAFAWRQVEECLALFKWDLLVKLLANRNRDLNQTPPAGVRFPRFRIDVLAIAL